MMRVKGGGRLRTEPEMAAVEQDRPSADFLEQAAGSALDGGTMARKGVDEILLARRRRAEVILQRGRRDRAAHAATFDERREAERGLEVAIRRMFGRKRYLHDDHRGGGALAGSDTRARSR
ncbi:hypothetical protein F01_400004 [Burkholderia cenocepacia]|nr:hypothetical protein F01_400004 [Burkholderia cenocepacia]